MLQCNIFRDRLISNATHASRCAHPFIFGAGADCTRVGLYLGGSFMSELVSQNEAIRLTDVTLGYDRHPAVHHVSASIEKGEMLAVVGPNGGGKSTLLKSIVNRLKPLSGQVTVSDDNIAFLPQLNALDLSFPITVFDVVGTGLAREAGMFSSWSAEQRRRINQSLDSVGMADFHSQAVGALSGGQIQRVLFARVLVQQAPLVVLDEPFSALDGATTEEMVGLLHGINKSGTTVIAVLHDMRLVRKHFPRALMLARELIAHGDTHEVFVPENILKSQHMPESFNDVAQVCQHEHALELKKSA